MLWNSYCVQWFSFVLRAWSSFRKRLFTENSELLQLGLISLWRESSSFSSLWWEGGAHPRPEHQVWLPWVCLTKAKGEGQDIFAFSSPFLVIKVASPSGQGLSLSHTCTNAKWKCSRQSFGNDSHLSPYLSNTGHDTCLSLLQKPFALVGKCEWLWGNHRACLCLCLVIGGIILQTKAMDSNFTCQQCDLVTVESQLPLFGPRTKDVILEKRMKGQLIFPNLNLEISVFIWPSGSVRIGVDSTCS